MKRNLRKSKGQSFERKEDTRRSSNLDLSLDNSLDQIFRFDDKLIGKRTNAMFEPKPIEDGFYQIELKSNIHSDLSSYKYESFDSYDVDEISEIDEKKNQKVVRMLKEIQMEASQLTLNDLSQIEKLIEEDESDQSDHRNDLNKGTQQANITILQNGNKSSESKQLPTVQKKNSPSQDQDNVPQIDQEKSTKSRPNSNKKKEEKKLKKNKANQSNNQERRKSKGEFNGQKKNQINVLTMETPKETTYQRMKRQQDKKQNLLKQVVEKDKNLTKNRETENIFKVPSQYNQRQAIGQVRNPKQGATYERKRLPRIQSYSDSDQQQKTSRLKKFNFKININDHGDDLDYSPLGTIRNTRYPQRLRIPPLRGWQNEKRNYQHGRLSSITLIDDSYGREVEKTIRIQKQKIRD